MWFFKQNGGHFCFISYHKTFVYLHVSLFSFKIKAKLCVKWCMSLTVHARPCVEKVVSVLVKCWKWPEVMQHWMISPHQLVLKLRAVDDSQLLPHHTAEFKPCLCRLRSIMAARKTGHTTGALLLSLVERYKKQKNLNRSDPKSANSFS